MGVPIHFAGRVADPSRVDEVIDAAVVAAELRGWAAQRFAKETATVQRNANDRQWEYSGPTKGVVFTPHEWCEPLCLEFDRDGVVQDFVKTQYAGVDTHVAVVGLLRELMPSLDSLEIADEGEYWDTGDRQRLARLIAECDEQLAQHLRGNPGLRGPIRLDDGRIIDLVEARIDEVASTKPWWKVW